MNKIVPATASGTSAWSHLRPRYAERTGAAGVTLTPTPHLEEELLAELEALERLLDDALEDSFPASDPIALTAAAHGRLPSH